MSAVSRCISLTALVALFGVAAASEVKGPVRISAGGVTDYAGDTSRFQADMDAVRRNDAALVAQDGFSLDLSFADLRFEMSAHDAGKTARAEARRAHEEARKEARRMAAMARAEARAAAEAARHAAREVAREAAREARLAARVAMRDARRHAADARAAADEAMREARARLSEARRKVSERRREMDEDRRDRGVRWDNAIEVRNGRIVRCSDPSKYPGTDCTPFTAEEKARIEAETHAAATRARTALDRAEAQLRAAERAISR